MVGGGRDWGVLNRVICYFFLKESFDRKVDIRYINVL